MSGVFMVGSALRALAFQKRPFFGHAGLRTGISGRPVLCGCPTTQILRFLLYLKPHPQEIRNPRQTGPLPSRSGIEKGAAQK